MAASIKEFGFKVPIVVDGENVIINGHTRLKAANKLGLKQVPVIVADDLTPEQVKAFRLADNKESEAELYAANKLRRAGISRYEQLPALEGMSNASRRTAQEVTDAFF